jgi:hypothetical protein
MAWPSFVADNQRRLIVAPAAAKCKHRNARLLNFGNAAEAQV